MDFLNKIVAFLHTEFDYLFTSVSAIFNTILSEVPDDEIAILHAAMQAVAAKLAAGASYEEALTEGLNTVGTGEIAELSKLGRELLQAFTTATAPKA